MSLLVCDVVVAGLRFQNVLFEVGSTFRAEVAGRAGHCASVSSETIKPFLAILTRVTLVSALENTEFAHGAVMKTSCVAVGTSRADVACRLVSGLRSQRTPIAHKAWITGMVCCVDS